MTQTAGTSINGIAANKFERVCGHKGYSYDAFHDNEKEAEVLANGGDVEPHDRSRVFVATMEDIGYEDCDYVSNEINYNWCKYTCKSVGFVLWAGLCAQFSSLSPSLTLSLSLSLSL